MIQTARQVLLGLLLFSVLPCTGQEIACGDESAAPPLPPAGRQALDWFPDDTETLAAAGSFQIERDAAQHNPDQEMPKLDPPKVELGIRLFALEGFWELDGGRYFQALAGNRVVAALRGARNFDVVSRFGSLRNEGCAVIVFEKRLDDIAKGWLQTLRGGAKQVRRIENREVFVFPSTTVMDHMEQKPWQGTFILLAQPNTLLCATSDRYLTDLLRRLDAKSPGHAPLLDLPEWKQIDRKSGSWLLRHIPDHRPRRKINGLTLSANSGGFRLVYLPSAKSDKRLVNRVRAMWNPQGLELQPDIRLQKDGTVVVASASGLDSQFVWALYHLPAEEGTLGAE